MFAKIMTGDPAVAQDVPGAAITRNLAAAETYLCTAQRPPTSPLTCLRLAGSPAARTGWDGNAVKADYSAEYSPRGPESPP